MEPEPGALRSASQDAADLPSDTIKARLAAERAARERLGAVNLRAVDELAEAEGRRAALQAERDEVDHAVNRLRGQIGALNSARRSSERLSIRASIRMMPCSPSLIDEDGLSGTRC